MKQWLLAAALAALTALAVYAQSGVITEITGTVELKLPGAAAFQTAKTGDAVASDTVVSTGLRSTAVIEVGSARIIVRPFTLLSLRDIARNEGTEQVNVNLRTGRVRVDVTPPSGAKAALTVESAHATASVRGTSFELDSRNLYVYTGTVRYQGTDGSAVLVSAGSESRVNPATGAITIPMESYRSELLPKLPVSGPPGGAFASALTDGAAFSASAPLPEVTYEVNIDLFY